MMPDLEHKLCKALRDHPSKFANRYDVKARTALLEILFRSLTNDRPDYLSALFPSGFSKSYKLTDAQGTTERSEYTEAARGHPCGHIFKQGEASYHCMTCTDDATCVLCSRCFDSSDHEGHQFHISASAGNSGCCDCGDLEAWKRPVNCAIHTASEKTRTEDQPSPLPLDLINSIRTTIGRVLDYFCDVISCSPEQLRLPKSEESIRHDESFSRLGPKWYAGGDEYEVDPEYCLIVWNDEKHTIVEVSDVIKRACRQTTKFGSSKAWEADDVGRSILRHSRDLKELIRMSNIVESIKVTTTIRTSRDTFREQMCGTIIEWLADIAGCSVGDDHHILRYTICEEMLQLWRVGSEAYNAQIGRSGIDDHEYSETTYRRATIPALLELEIAPEETGDDEDEDEIVEPGAEEESDEMDVDDPSAEQARNRIRRREREWATMQMELLRTDERLLPQPRAMASAPNRNGDMDEASDEEAGQSQQTESLQRQAANVTMPIESDPGEVGFMPDDQNRNYKNVPRTPYGRRKRLEGGPPTHWAVQPSNSAKRSNIPPHEDLSMNIRLDSMILFDMRMWKKARIALRDLYISTVVNVPAFKRILGLRFSCLYTSLSQLYLIADREPDHSIINLSLQMLTSPSITEEVIERGNFLTNLMAILYTFLTSRQVGFPQDVSPSATLAFDTGSVTNRRLYHFFTDLRYFLSSEPVQRKVREERQYLLQFIDLVKLSQGICPNVRAVGEHVEYETDAWIGASLLTREINKLCRQFSESFSATNSKGKGSNNIAEAIYTTAFATIVNSVGLERKRFDQTEIKEVIEFKLLPPFEFETAHYSERKAHRVIDYVVEKDALSFHHALHYTLSWLIEGGKSLSNLELRRILTRAGSDFIKQYGTLKPTYPGLHEPEDALLAVYDFPLRVCAWLAQMKAGLWVRNGMSLRHQMSQYKGVSFRDVGYHRDIFLLQTAIVTCDPARVLATMIDRYGLESWMRGDYDDIVRHWENSQFVDILEDFIYLLIIILTDRASLITIEDEPNHLLVATRKDIIHALCFKPLSFSELNAKLNEKVQDYQDLQSVLEEMTTFRAPEGLTDSGTFELKLEYLAQLDPYNTNYNKNQRDEAENIYKRWMSKKTGKPAEEIVLEPNLRPIRSGVYTGLTSFTSSPLFAQIIYYALKYVHIAKTVTPDVPATRLESLLHVILQLALVATLEDDTTEEDFTEESMQSFIRHALTTETLYKDQGPATIIEILQMISNMDENASCRPKIKHILKLFYRKRSHDFNQAAAHLDFRFGRLDSISPANVDQGLEAKKRQALERKAKVMAQFQQQQKNFMDNQAVSDWYDEDLSDTETEAPHPPERKVWKYPTGVCILCQEETNDFRLYGTFGMFTESNILRQTNLDDADWVREVLNTSSSLDRSVDNIRPFGVSGENHEQVVRLTAEGNQIITDRQGLGKGWPAGFTRRSPISTGCGHLMHFACFDHYFRSVVKRHAQQIARHHPERTKNNEFVCPLCKALGNTFLPVLWKEKEESYPGVLSNEESLESFLNAEVYRILPRQQNLEQNDFETVRSGQAFFSAPISTGFGEVLRKAASFGRPMSPNSHGVSPLTELSRVFVRLGDTINTNRLNVLQISPSSAQHLPNLDVLISIIGSSVSAAEIAQRGIAVEPDTILLEKIPAQMITHLRILSETFNSYITIGEISFESLADDFASAQKRLFRQLFVRSMSGLMNNSGRMRKATSADPTPLLLEDIFDILTRSCFVLGPTLKLNIHHILHLCYMAQIVQVVMAYLYNSQGLANLQENSGIQRFHSPSLPPPTNPEVRALTALTEWMMDNIYHTGYMPSKPVPGSESALFVLIRSYSLAFLRKATILLYVSYGVDFPSSSDPETSELDRLSHLLKLPDLCEMLSNFQPYSGKQSIKDQVAGWILSLAKYQHSKQIEEGNDIPRYSSAAFGADPEFTSLIINLSRNMSLPHPAPLELIGLPKHFDVLMEEANRRKCPSTGKDLTDPGLCLFCGEIFCSQAVCCMKNKIGPANLHVEKCSPPIGLFLSIRKCTILLLHIVPQTSNITNTPSSSSSTLTSSGGGGGTPRSNGSWFHAPYLTRHGEVDPGLRQRHQLVLSQKRYDRLLRDVWLMLNGNVWSTVARKLEGEINGGGWESL